MNENECIKLKIGITQHSKILRRNQFWKENSDKDHRSHWYFSLCSVNVVLSACCTFDWCRNYPFLLLYFYCLLRYPFTSLKPYTWYQNSPSLNIHRYLIEYLPTTEFYCCFASLSQLGCWSINHLHCVGFSHHSFQFGGLQNQFVHAIKLYLPFWGQWSGQEIGPWSKLVKWRGLINYL